ncbi:hypothetical protein B0H13DRAFT_1850877 [Mycena leptocephala]|nr:hypothetical protein B0H13DRAFT_1850877 [Mycena leptocephala]
MAEKLSSLYVLPPYGFREQAQDALTATDWAETEFDEHEIATVLSDPQTCGYIFSDWPGKPTGPVNFLPGKDSWKDILLQEMLLMAIRWQREPDLKVSIWSWDKFRELCLGDFDTFVAVASVYDLVFGGADLTVEGAGFVSISPTPQSTAESTPRREFENDEDERTYMDRMTQLDGMTAVFPNRTTSWATRFNAVTNSERPVMQLLRSADEYTENVVLKREASARSQHRHFFDRPSQVPAARIAQMIEENKRTGPQWLLQELNPVLRKCGELHAFVVLKQVIGVVATTPTDEDKNGLDFEECGANYALEEFSVGGTRVQHDHARQQFEAFTLATLATLIQKDEQRYACESDLAYLARLDVTYFEKGGVWSFCINEVEHPLMDLFSRTDVAERVMDELGVAMRVRIRSQQALEVQVTLKIPLVWDPFWITADRPMEASLLGSKRTPQVFWAEFGGNESEEQLDGGGNVVTDWIRGRLFKQFPVLINFNDTVRTWLVIWEAGVAIQMPPWTMAIYPSSLFYHFNIDVEDIQFVTTDPDAQPTKENSRPILPGDKQGRGSMVFFNQATMRTLQETGHDTLKKAKRHGHSGTSNCQERAQAMFSRSEFYHNHKYWHVRTK